MNGAADIIATLFVLGILLYGGYKVVMWLVDKFIEAIDWMTRHEN